ncbi:MAG TPA: hypothetical protein VN903_35000 [Polyangia bacterium]|nr:hypothetical protein [Polyangia bacterium]
MKVRAAAWLSFVLAGLPACAGEIDPSLIPSANSPPPPCDAPKTVFATNCAIAGCHAANSSSGGGLDLASAGVVGRLLGKGPSSNLATGARCADAGKPYLLANSNPASGLLMDKIDATKVTCGSAMSLLGQIDSSQITCISLWATAVTTGAVTQ